VEEPIYTVPGMSCAGCEAAELEELKRTDGAASVQVDLASKRVVVTGSALSDPALRAAIAAGGYEAKV